MIESEESLVQSAQRGDRAAFEELVRRTSRMVYARLYLETGNAHRAEDLLQETLLVAFRSLNQIAEPKKFRGWLLKISQRVAIDALRRDLRKKRGGGVSEPPGLSRREQPALKIASPEEEAEKNELRQKVLAVLRSLPEEYRLPLTMRYIAGADHETIQMQMGVSNGALRGLLHRGLKLMRSEMQKVLGEEWIPR